MPEIPMVGGAPPAGGVPPQQATGPQPGTVPMPNRGSEQTALLAIGMHAQQIQTLINQLPFGSDAAQQISEAINKIRKHVPPPGAIAPGLEQAQLQAMQLAQKQNAMRQALTQQQAAAGAHGGAGGGMPPPAAMRPPPQLMQPQHGM